MPKPNPDLRLVPKERPATPTELAQIEFRALKAIRNLTKGERIRKMRQKVRSLYPMAVIAAEVVALSKAELIDLVRTTCDEPPVLVEELAEATDTAKMLVEVIRAAQARLTVALANVEDGRTA